MLTIMTSIPLSDYHEMHNMVVKQTNFGFNKETAADSTRESAEKIVLRRQFQKMKSKRIEKRREFYL